MKNFSGNNNSKFSGRKPVSESDRKARFEKKDDQPRASQPRTEQPKYGQPRTEQPKYGQPRTEQPKYGQPRTEQPKYGQPRTEQPKYGQPRDGQPKYGQPRTEQPKYGQPRTEQPKYGQPRTEQPKYGQPRTEQPKYGQPRTEQPKYGQPRTEQPKYGQPRAEQPKYGQPRTEQPKYGQPRTEQPKYGQPREHGFKRSFDDRAKTMPKPKHMLPINQESENWQENESDDSRELIFQLEGRNPILEALKNDKPIDTLIIKKGEYEGTIRVITAMAREKGILIKEMSKEKMDSISQTGNHQGVIAVCPEKGYSTVEEILEEAEQSGKKPFLVLLDGVTDPHNLGAILRTAECAGVDGIVIPKRRAVGLTPTVAKVSAGALEYVKVARVSNINQTIDILKKRGIWVYCADMDGQSLFKTDFSGGTALVIGGEGEGISRLVKENCDVVVNIPMFGKIESLNVSVAASLLMYEVARNRQNE